MTNNPMVSYKPGLTMDTPVSITMAAADWAVLMSWFAHVNTDGVDHIVYGVVADQIADALYSQASLQAAKAAHAAQKHPFMEVLQQMGLPVSNFPEPDDFNQPTIFADSIETWIIRCDTCGSRDEYPPRFTGELTCEHNGPRTVIEIQAKRKE